MGRHGELFWPDNDSWYLIQIKSVDLVERKAKVGPQPYFGGGGGVPVMWPLLRAGREARTPALSPGVCLRAAPTGTVCHWGARGPGTG